MKQRAMKALSWAVFPALLVGGFAIAAPGGGGSDGADTDEFELRAPRPALGAIAFAGHGPVGAFGEGDLTFSETHVLRDGEPVTLRTDRGTVDSVSEDSLTITRNDDSQVTIPVDSETLVLKKPEPEMSDPRGTLDDLAQGDEVIVHREDESAAKMIAVLPEDGDFMPLPPPGEFGGAAVHEFGSGEKGTIESISEDEITLSQGDDPVTIPVDSETRVLRPPALEHDGDGMPRPPQPPAPGDLSDLEEGDEVIVHREDGEAADVIALVPEGDVLRFRFDGMDAAPVPAPPPETENG